ncbi:MAG TPA: hypothetical protein VGC09_22175 [Rhodopila sp.]
MDVIVYRTREMTQSVAKEVGRLRSELPDYALVIVAYRPDYTEADSDPENGLFCYGWQDLAELPYPGQLKNIDFRKPTGRHDLPVLKFYREHPNFDRYWVIEDDVRWTGPWRTFADELQSSDAALLATTVQTRAENPDWHWWNTMGTAGEPMPELVKCFGPFLRASAACVALVNEKYTKGWHGHFEVAWPTICCDGGLKVEDIGGSGSFTPRRWRDRFYRNDPDAWNLAPGTFIWRPTYHEADFKDFIGQFAERPYLWHPVKG